MSASNKGAASLGVHQGDDRHFIGSQFRVRLDDLEDVDIDEGDQPVSPGPFHGEVSVISLSKDTRSVFDKAAEYRQFVRALVGIKIYRDGFGVRVNDDWLALGTKWTSGSSYYSMRPGNVVGYISISASENAALEETTNREAFRDTPAYRNFYRLLTAWTDYTGRVQEYLRRNYNEYRKVRTAAAGGVTPRATPDDLIRRANDQIDQTAQLARRSAQARVSIRDIQAATIELERQQQATATTLFRDPALHSALDRTIGRVRDAAVEADALIRNIDSLLEEQTRLKAGIDLLAQQLATTQEQIGDAWESVALGLSAETLAHEVQQISDGLRARSAQITRYLTEINYRDQRVWTFVEHVRSASGGLSKQVSRLTPSLRYIRERRADVAMAEAVARLRDYYADRWGSNGLRIAIEPLHDFTIHINEGKLTQVFDNLILNSEYWLLQQIKAKKLDEGEITIRIDRPLVLVEDNGPGIDPSIEELIFDPFITMKPAQEGRGLGLFVVRQLLDSMNASITLAPDRNARGRRYQFRLNFASAPAQADTTAMR